MKEELLQFVWRFQLYETFSFATTDGDPIEVIHPGSTNVDSGPDFFNAKIRIGDEYWAGNVEIHNVTSDWQKHGHHTNKAYDSVVLHVVAIDDGAEVYRTTGTPVKCAVMHFDGSIEERYRQMVESDRWIACHDSISAVNPFLIRQYLERILVEKLSRKVEIVESDLRKSTRSWDDVFYKHLLRCFGFSINTLPFEMLAGVAPLSVLRKHRESLASIEAILLGQAGLLQVTSSDAYAIQLAREYKHLKAKYALQPLDGSIWKFLRTRPQNFPTVRLAQLAALIHKHHSLFAEVVKCQSAEEFKRLLRSAESSSYWQHHYQLGVPTKSSVGCLGEASLLLLCINLFIPFVFAYGHINGYLAMKEKALDMLQTIPPERNSIIERWQMLGMPVESAFDTQALLFLKKEYCDTKQCLRCTIGKKVLENSLVNRAEKRTKA